MPESLTKAGNIAHDGFNLPLTELVVNSEKREELSEEAKTLSSLQLSSATTAWLHLMAIGALAPVQSFMGRADYEAVRATCRLMNGSVFPLPSILPVERAGLCQEGQRIALRDSSNHLLAVLTVEEIFEIAGTTLSEPRLALSGRPEILQMRNPLPFSHLYRTAVEVRRLLFEMDCRCVLAADQWTEREREPQDQLRQESENLGACLLLNVFATSERPDDFDSYIRLRDCAREFESSFRERALLNYLPAPAGTKTVRGILMNALIHRNFGANYSLFDPPSATETPEDAPACISPQALQETMAELGLQALIRKPESIRSNGRPVDFRRAATRSSDGLCVWFTGLPGAGKSTIAEQLIVQLMERGRRVTLLDGDIVRTQLSRGLTFSRADRDINVQRIGFVASEIVRHGGIAVCAAVSPYREARSQVRRMMGNRLVEVFVDTPVEICEQRDVKGFYAKARNGQLHAFTGVDDPYEPPEHPEIRIAAGEATPRESTQQVIDYLLRIGYLDLHGTEQSHQDSLG